jgi:hypothetical protein
MAKEEVQAPVYDGEFEDHEWRAIAAKKEPDRTRAERIRYAQPPKRHPFPASDVHAEEVTFPDGQVRTRYHSSKEAARAFKAKHESGDQRLKVKAITGGSRKPQEGQGASDATHDAEDAERASLAFLETHTAQELAPVGEAPVSQAHPAQAGLDKSSIEAHVRDHKGA